MRYDELPPLAFLPALEAAGRLGSFKAAAGELHITPSAVSQQVKAVEEALGVALFERRNRTILVRPEGVAYLNEVGQSLRELVRASSRVRGNSKRVVRGSTAPVTNFTRNTRVYRQNVARDRDGDGIACEQH